MRRIRFTFVAILLSVLVASTLPAAGTEHDEDANEGGAAAFPLGASVTLAGAESVVIVETRDISRLGIIDPAGIAYLSNDDALLISDSEINEEPTLFQGFNIWELTRTGVPRSRGLSPEPGPLRKKEPTGLAYNPANSHVFMSNDLTQSGSPEKFIYEILPGADGRRYRDLVQLERLRINRSRGCGV